MPIQNEEAVLGLTWTGGVVELRDEEATADVEYIVPEDGTLYWMDTWVIFNEAPHPNAAHAFLNFIHDPQIQAQETVTNRYATPNDEAKKYEPEEILDDPAVFVPQEIFDAGLLKAPRTPPTDPLRNEIWEDFLRKIGGLVDGSKPPEVRTILDDRQRDGGAARAAPLREPKPPFPGAGPFRADGRRRWRAPAIWYLLLLVIPLADRRPVQLRQPGRERRLRGRLHAQQPRRPGRSPTRSGRACSWLRPGRSRACSSGCRSPTISRPAPDGARAC